jgi:hypothetical protein
VRCPFPAVLRRSDVADLVGDPFSLSEGVVVLLVGHTSDPRRAAIDSAALDDEEQPAQSLVRTERTWAGQTPASLCNLRSESI